MGYQESFVKFQNVEALNAVLKEYALRNKNSDPAEIVCVDRVKKAIAPFKEGELLAVVCGDRVAQRGTVALEAYLGIKGAKDVIFMDNYLFQYNFDIDFPVFLEEHFEKIPLKDYMTSIGIDWITKEQKWDALFKEYQELPEDKKKDLFPRIFAYLEHLGTNNKPITPEEIFDRVAAAIRYEDKGGGNNA